MRWTTSIPRGVGLGGSSAIVIATLRALCDLHDARARRDELAELALADRARRARDRGRAPGPGRAGVRRADVHGVRSGRGPERYRAARLGPAAATRGRLARRTPPGTRERSTPTLRDRHARGEPEVVRAMSQSWPHWRAAPATRCSPATTTEFARCVDHSFDARQRILALDPRHVEMIECARGVRRQRQLRRLRGRDRRGLRVGRLASASRASCRSSAATRC